jgi:hypothetical protein
MTAPLTPAEHARIVAAAREAKAQFPPAPASVPARLAELLGPSMQRQERAEEDEPAA